MLCDLADYHLLCDLADYHLLCDLADYHYPSLAFSLHHWYCGSLWQEEFSQFVLAASSNGGNSSSVLPAP